MSSNLLVVRLLPTFLAPQPCTQLSMIRRPRASSNLPRLLLIGTITLLAVFALWKTVNHRSSREDASVSIREIKSSKEQPEGMWVETISWKPRIFLAHNFLTHEECDKILELAGSNVERSKVVGANGEDVVDPARSSYGTFLTRFTREPVYKAIEERISKWSQLPVSHGEVMYLLRYQQGQEYKPHFDYFDVQTQQKHIGSAGNRVATVVMYLSDVEEGGETYFPNAEGGERSVKPKKGDAVLFWDYTPDGKPDPLSLHGGRPVIKGVKWSLTRWIRAKPFWFERD